MEIMQQTGCEIQTNGWPLRLQLQEFHTTYLYGEQPSMHEDADTSSIS